MIAGFLAAVAFYDARLAAGGQSLDPMAGRFDLSSLPVLLGLLIVVQGFETSRYLGEEFDGKTRIGTMRLAQAVAAVIFLVFFLLMLPLLPDTINAEGDTAIIDAAVVVGAVLPAMLTIGAVASQFSAAVADAIGGAGLFSEVAGKRLSINWAFPLLGAATIAVVWATNIFQVIALASKAFALYYMLQCLVAAAEVREREGLRPRTVWYLALAALAGSVLVLGVPAE